MGLHPLVAGGALSWLSGALSWLSIHSDIWSWPMHTQKSKSKISWCKRYSENGRTDTTDRITCLSFAAGNYRKPVLDVDPTTFAIFTSPTGPGSVLARTLNSRETLPGPRLGKTISWDTDKTRYDTIREAILMCAQTQNLLHETNN